MSNLNLIGVMMRRALALQGWGLRWDFGSCSSFSPQGGGILQVTREETMSGLSLWEWQAGQPTVTEACETIFFVRNNPNDWAFLEFFSRSLVLQSLAWLLKFGSWYERPRSGIWSSLKPTAHICWWGQGHRHRGDNAFPAFYKLLLSAHCVSQAVIGPGIPG